MSGYEIIRKLVLKPTPDLRIDHFVEVRTVRFDSSDVSSRKTANAVRQNVANPRPVVSRLKTLAAKEVEIAAKAPIEWEPQAPAEGRATDPRAVASDATTQPPLIEVTMAGAETTRLGSMGTLVVKEAMITGRISMPSSEEGTLADGSADKLPVDTNPPPSVSQTDNSNTESLGTSQRRSSSEAVIRTAIIGEYIYASIALMLGLASIIAGSLLCLYGVAGHTSFTASLLGLSTNLNDAAPGVVLFVIGLFMIWATRPKVKLSDLVG